VRDYRDTLAYEKGKHAAFVFGMQERGIRLIGRGLWYLSAAHTRDEIDHAVTMAREVLGSLDG
jgi:glutamate-1-semialdehyde 2,1-aminomutase